MSSIKKFITNQAIKKVYLNLLLNNIIKYKELIKKNI